MEFLDNAKGKASALASVGRFIWTRKKWWLAPLLIVLVLFGIFIVLTEGTVLAPLIYTLF
jgi:hypothetical protein